MIFDFDRRAASVVLVATLASAHSAHAGDCPADQVGVNALPNAPTATVDVVDTEIASIGWINDGCERAT